MKLATIAIDGSATAAVLNRHDRLVPVGAIDAALPTTLRELLHVGTLSEFNPRADEVDGHDPDAVTFLPVIPEPHAIWCATLNYATHVQEGGWEPPERPGWFLRVADTLVGHGQPLIKPTISDRFDYEGELAVVIGTPGRHISRDAAMSHVAGYACFNDASVRDWQRHTTQITPGKNFSATGGFGPYLVTADEIPDVTSSRLMTRLNGKLLQNATVGDMLTPIPDLISYLSDIGELRTGDVIVTGTPGGVGARQTPELFMFDGDVIEVEIDGVGVLRNPINAEEAA